MDYQECIKKAYQGFVLTPGNIDINCTIDMLGYKVQTEEKIKRERR